MSVIDISKGYRTYSPEELRNAAYCGIVYCGNKDLTDFLEYIFKGFDEEVQEASDKQGNKRYEDGWEDAVNEIRGYLENI